jgi:hypothetical protein
MIEDITANSQLWYCKLASIQRVITIEWDEPRVMVQAKEHEQSDKKFVQYYKRAFACKWVLPDKKGQVGKRLDIKENLHRQTSESIVWYRQGAI